jgi:kynurenine formamidase
MTSQTLQQFAAGIASGAIRTIDLTQTLSPDTPTLVLPPEFGQCAGFSQEEISRYDERGVAWYWNNFTVSEHTGTHFDAPIHWITGKDLPTTRSIRQARRFHRPCGGDRYLSKIGGDPDYLLTVADIEAWEAEHGASRHAAGSCCAPIGRSATVDAYTNRREDGAHTPGPSAEAVKFLIDERDAHGLGVETIGTDAGQAHLLNRPIPPTPCSTRAGRYGLQCLENLDLLPATGSVVMATPLKIGRLGQPLARARFGRGLMAERSFKAEVEQLRIWATARCSTAKAS